MGNQPKKLTNPPILAVGVFKQSNPLDTSLVIQMATDTDTRTHTVFCGNGGWAGATPALPIAALPTDSLLCTAWIQPYLRFCHGALPRGPGVTRGAGNAGGAWEGPREGGKGPPPGKGVAHWIFAPGWAEIPNRYATMNWSGK